MTHTLIIKNLGSIHSVSVSLTPLTILTGDDETAISLVTRSIYALSVAHQEGSYPVPNWDTLLENENISSSTLVQSIVQAGTVEYYDSYMSHPWRKYLHGYPGKNGRCTITIQKELLSISLHIAKGGSIEVNECNCSLPEEPARKIPRCPPKTEKEIELLDSFIEEVFERWMDAFFGDFCFDPFYIPASRYEIMQGFPWLEDDEIRHPPIIEDFLGWMKALVYQETPEEGWWEYFENKLLTGPIIVKENDDDYDEIIVKKGKQIKSLLKMSESVIAISPLFLCVKYHSIYPLMIIMEDADAYLTEKEQTIFAEFLIFMIQEGIQIVINTKNEAFIEIIKKTIQKLSPGMFDGGIISYDMISLCQLERTKEGYVGSSRQLWSPQN